LHDAATNIWPIAKYQDNKNHPKFVQTAVIGRFTCILEQFLESTGKFKTGTCSRRARNYNEENQTRPLSFDLTLSLTVDKSVFTHGFIIIVLAMRHYSQIRNEIVNINRDSNTSSRFLS